jgi:dipeptide/tripeptide permease
MERILLVLSPALPSPNSGSSSLVIAFIELAERFSYYGTTVVFTNFIQQPLPPGSKTGSVGKLGQPGALGQGQQASTGLTTFNSFWSVHILLLILIHTNSLAHQGLCHPSLWRLYG